MIQPLQLTQETWENLIKPLSQEDPCGPYLLYEKIYDEIQEARFEEDESLPQGVWKRDLKKANWHRVADLCIQALTQETKDLQLAAWLMEAWTILHGIQGVEKGLKLMEAYTDTLWASIHPRIRDDDLEFRLAPFEWIDQKFVERLKFIPLTHQTQGTTYYTLADWQLANERKGKAQEGKSKDSRAMTLEDFHRGTQETPLKYYQSFRDDLDQAMNHVVTLEALIYEKNAAFPGYLNHLKEMMQTLLTCVTMILREKQPTLMEKETSTHDRKEATPLPAKGADLLACREEAYARLGEIADYLAAIEPHSPSPYLIRRAIKWGRMSVVDLLKEMVKEGGNYQGILDLLGVKEVGEKPEG